MWRSVHEAFIANPFPGGTAPRALGSGGGDGGAADRAIGHGGAAERRGRGRGGTAGTGARRIGRSGAGAWRNGGAAEQERGRGGTVPVAPRKVGFGLGTYRMWQSGDGQIGRPRVPSSVRVSSRTCGDVWFRQGPDTGEREPRLPSGLVKKVAKRSTWQPPVDSRPRCLGSKVSVEATSASWVVEASLSEAAIRTSVT